MSIARHHAEWLSLLEISGPFLSMPVLLRAFPQGLGAGEAGLRRELRMAFEEWQERREEPAFHRAWVRWLLREALGMTDEVLHALPSLPDKARAALAVAVAEHGEMLAPDWVVAQPVGANKHSPHNDSPPARLLVTVVPPDQELERPLRGGRWMASPATRMMTLLHATGVRLGLVTNGERWMLVDAPRGETTGFVSWYAPLWLEEPLTLQAFATLLHVRRFFGVREEETIEALLAASASDQQEVTDQLGEQVRHAVELLVRAWDRADEEHERALLRDVPEARLYEAALRVMMRLVFLLAAEERGLLLLGDALYDEHYAIATLRDQLRERADQQGEQVLERQHDAWNRLLATFRAVFGGIQHDRLTLPAYGGSLFDPDEFPWLEGRAAGSSWRSVAARPLPVNNRTVLHLLDALQLLQVKVPGGGPAEARRLSFRALDIEQIGHVYEGLLDHRVQRARATIIGLQGTRHKEPELLLATVEAEQARGEASFLSFLREQTGRSASALRRALLHEPDAQEQARLRVACGHDAALFARVRPFAGLLRADSYGEPVVIAAGGVYVTSGTERRESGTHYTPRSLTEPIVQHTLEPLVFDGPAEGKPRAAWRLRSPSALLGLKVCDMAAGSGAFLVQACRFLSERLVEAWEATERQKGRRARRGKAESERASGATGGEALWITPEGALTDDADAAIPADPSDRLALARRLVADRCLYGVDKNPLAVEMAKLSLWLATLSKGLPFTFLDHAIKSGDSLVGVGVEQLVAWDLHHTGEFALQIHAIQSTVEAVIRLRTEIAATPTRDAADLAHKEGLLREAEARSNDLRDAADLLVGSYFNELNRSEQATLRQSLLYAVRDGRDVLPEHARQADLGDLRPFHWPLEFPEVFLAQGRNGFDAFVGNPPFVGGQRIRGRWGASTSPSSRPAGTTRAAPPT